MSVKPKVELIFTVALMEKYVQRQISRKWQKIRCWSHRRSDRKL